MSGSGKSCAIKSLEDAGFFCVDNLPTALVPKFVELCAHSGKGYQRAVLGIDIRERDFFGNFNQLYDTMKKAGQDTELIFLDASDEALVRRFSETRRPHPLAKDKPLVEAIRAERQMMEPIRQRADAIIDTTSLTVHQLRERLASRYQPKNGGQKMTISVMSFGFKYGVPYDADLVFDVRFLPNPNFVPGLKELTGMDKLVQDFVRKKKQTTGFLTRLTRFLDFLLPLYEGEGRTYLTIAIGCTGGRHRSAAVAESLKGRLKDRGLDIIIRHRDISR